MTRAARSARWHRPFLGAAILLLGGCGLRWDASRAPDGFGIIREHVIAAPRNLPPVHSRLDFTIVQVDGGSPTRERTPFWVDIEPGVQVAAGSHRLLARVAPHLRPANYEPKEVSFVVTLQSGKVYLLVDDEEGRPILVECHPQR